MAVSFSWAVNTQTAPSFVPQSGVYSPDLGLYVVVGYGHATTNIWTSPDAVTWTGRTAPGTIRWRDIAWSPSLDLFVAVGSNAAEQGCITSPDGITWTERTMPSVNNWYGVTWSADLSLFVAVGLNKVAYSSNGTSWSSGTIDSNEWYGVTWAPSLGMFAAFGGNGTTNNIATSTDGNTWTTRTTPATVTFGNLFGGNHIGAWSTVEEVFCAVGITTGLTHKAVVSSDGINWTLNDLPETFEGSGDSNWPSITWVAKADSTDGVFVVVGDTSAAGSITDPAPFAYSTDGVTWTTGTVTGSAEHGAGSEIALFHANFAEKLAYVAFSDSGTPSHIVVSATLSFVDPPPPTTLTMGYVSPPGIDYTQDWEDVTGTLPSDLRAPDKMGPLWTLLGKQYIGKPNTMGNGYVTNSSFVATNGYTVGEEPPKIVTISFRNQTTPVVEADLFTVSAASSGPSRAVAWIENCAYARTWTTRTSGVRQGAEGPLTMVGLYDVGESNADVAGRVLAKVNAAPPVPVLALTGELPTAIAGGRAYYTCVGTHTTSLTDPGKIYVISTREFDVEIPNNANLIYRTKDLSDYTGVGGARCAMENSEFIPAGVSDYAVRAIGTDATTGGSARLIAFNHYDASWLTLFTGDSTAAGNAVTRVMATNRTDGSNQPYVILAYWNGTDTTTIYRSVAPYTTWTSVWTESDPIVGFAQFFYTTQSGVRQYRYLAWTGGDGVTPKLIINNSTNFTVWADITNLLNPNGTAAGFAGFLNLAG